MTQKIELHEGALEVMEATQFADTTAVSHAVHFDGALCTGCGLCTFICPAKRPLTQAFKQMRQAVAAERRKKK